MMIDISHNVVDRMLIIAIVYLFAYCPPQHTILHACIPLICSGVRFDLMLITFALFVRLVEDGLDLH